MFKFDSWVAFIAAFVAIAIFIGIVSGIHSYYKYEAKKMPKRRRVLKTIVWSAITFALTYMVANTVSYSTTTNGGPKFDSVTASEVFATNYGLEEGKEYPLIIGSRIDGTAGGGTFALGSGSIEVSPSASILISYDYDGVSYPLILPMGGVEFRQVVDANPTVSLQVDSATVRWASKEYEYGECRTVINWGWFTCEQDLEKTWFDVSTGANFGEKFPEHFESAVITLTPEMYEALLRGE